MSDIFLGCIFSVGTWLAMYIGPLLRRLCLSLFHQEYSEILKAQIMSTEVRGRLGEY